MTQPDNTWPPPPSILPPKQERQKGNLFTNVAVRLLLCYTLLWIASLTAALWLFAGWFWVLLVMGWPQMLAIQMVVLPCLHLPGVLFLRRLQWLRARKIVALTTAVWGSSLASLDWVTYNYVTGGYSYCDPTGLINWGCGISKTAILPYLLAGGITGYSVGSILANRYDARQRAV